MMAHLHRFIKILVQYLDSSSASIFLMYILLPINVITRPTTLAITNKKSSSLEFK